MWSGWAAGAQVLEGIPTLWRESLPSGWGPPPLTRGSVAVMIEWKAPGAANPPGCSAGHRGLAYLGTRGLRR
jgi:hypothetical protein